jgi:RNA polymerase sigma-70 factor (ECF subfamily)
MASSSGPTGSPQPGQAASDADRALAEALIAGRRDAFEPFVDRFAPLILNFGRRMCGQRDDADEVLQETLLKTFQSVKDLREPAALKSWVYRVAANACLKMRRRGKFEPRREISLDEVLPQPRGDGRPPEIPDWSEIPLDRLLQGELKEKIDEAILMLPKDFRIVLVLRDQEGLSTRETADILGITETLAKVRLHRARLALRKMLEGYVAQISGRPAAMRAEPMPHPPGKMTCREMAEYLSDYIDGALDASMRRLIDEHGGECPPCRAFVRTLARTVEAVRAQPRQPLPSALRKTLAEALRKACA